ERKGVTCHGNTSTGHTTVQSFCARRSDRRAQDNSNTCQDDPRSFIPLPSTGTGDTEARPLAGGAFELDAAPVIGHNAVADAQAQSGPLADEFPGEERVEDP